MTAAQAQLVDGKKNHKVSIPVRGLSPAPSGAAKRPAGEGGERRNDGHGAEP